MNNVFVLSTNSRLVGVYTSHRKAIQAMLMETLPFDYKMKDYGYDFGVEFYTFVDAKDTEKMYELQEVTLDERV